MKKTLTTILLAVTLGLASSKLANAQKSNFGTVRLSNALGPKLENIQKYNFETGRFANTLRPRLEKKEYPKMQSKFCEKAKTLNFHYPPVQKIELEKIEYINQNFYRRALGIETKKELKHHILANALVFMSGMFDGTAETLSHHYEQFEERFPNANSSIWNPDISYVRKYKNNDPSQGSKFPGSTGPLVFTTDAYHGARFVSKSTFVAGLIINPSFRKGKKWYQYAADSIVKYGFHNLGFLSTYDGIFKK